MCMRKKKYVSLTSLSPAGAVKVIHRVFPKELISSLNKYYKPYIGILKDKSK